MRSFTRPATLLSRALPALALAAIPARALPDDPEALLGTTADGKPFQTKDFMTSAAPSRIDFTGAHFWSFGPYGDLRGADFRGRTLDKAVLSGTDCRNADFSGVDLRTTVLDRTNLEGAIFTGAKILLQAINAQPSFRSADLSGALLFWSATDPEPLFKGEPALSARKPGPGSSGASAPGAPAPPPSAVPTHVSAPAASGGAGSGARPAPAPAGSPARQATPSPVRFIPGPPSPVHAAARPGPGAPPPLGGGQDSLPAPAQAPLVGIRPDGQPIHGKAEVAAAADLDGVVFLRGADLRFVDFRGKSLFAADLSGADCSGADFSEVNLADTVLLGTQLTGSVFDGATFLERVAASLRKEGLDLRTARTVAKGDLDSPGAARMDPLQADPWVLRFRIFKISVHLPGQFPVPPGTQVGGLDLYHWQQEQKAQRARLTQVQLDALASIPGMGAWLEQPAPAAASAPASAPAQAASKPRKRDGGQAKSGNGARERAWQKHYQDLKTFADQHNHIRVPRDEKIGEIYLRAWCYLQAGNRHALTPRQISLLEALPGWQWRQTAATPRQDGVIGKASTWEEHFELLKKFEAHYGHGDVPQRYKTVDGVHLGRWASKQRELYKDEEQGSLDAKRIAKLESIKDWAWVKYKGSKPKVRKAPDRAAEPAPLPMAMDLQDDDTSSGSRSPESQGSQAEAPAPAPAPPSASARRFLPAPRAVRAVASHPGRGSVPMALSRGPAARNQPPSQALGSGPALAALPSPPQPARPALDLAAMPPLERVPLPAPDALRLPQPAPALPPVQASATPVAGMVLGLLPGSGWLRGQDFARTPRLDGITFAPKANLRGIDFTGKSLADARFGNADCSNASFRGMDLSRTDLGTASFTGADFEGATLRAKDFARLKAQGHALAGASAQEAAGSAAAPAPLPPVAPEAAIGQSSGDLSATPGGKKRKPSESDPAEPAAKRPHSDPAASPDMHARPQPAAAPSLPPAALWSPAVEHLQAYVRAHGHADPGLDMETEDGFQLGHWVQRQRERRKVQDPSLAPDLVAALEAVSGWHW